MNEKNKDIKFLNAKDLSFFDLMVKRGSNLQKSAKKIVSFRTTERFRWALEIYKRYLGGQRQDSEVLEQCLWEALVRENPTYTTAQRFTLERQNKLTKFFFVYAENKDDETVYDIKYSSVVELTWSEFEIFRLIKLYVAEKSFLDSFELKLIEFILETKEFWLDGQNSFDDGFVSGYAIAETFEDPFNPEKEKSDDWESPLDKLRKSFNEGVANFDDLKIKEADEKSNQRELLITQEDRFAEELSFGHETGLVEKQMVIDHFPLEMDRLKRIVEKYAPVQKGE